MLLVAKVNILKSLMVNRKKYYNNKKERKKEDSESYMALKTNFTIVAGNGCTEKLHFQNSCKW